MRNAEQILAIITATFGGELFDLAVNDDFCSRKETEIEDLACRWRQLAASSKTMSLKSDSGEEWASTMSQVGKEIRLVSSPCADDCPAVAQRFSGALE